MQSELNRMSSDSKSHTKSQCLMIYILKYELMYKLDTILLFYGRKHLNQEDGYLLEDLLEERSQNLIVSMCGH